MLGASLLIQDALILANTAEDYGGGLNTHKEAHGLMDRVTIADNQVLANLKEGAAGADIMDAQLTLRNCTVSGNTAQSGAGGLRIGGSPTSVTL